MKPWKGVRKDQAVEKKREEIRGEGKRKNEARSLNDQEGAGSWATAGMVYTGSTGVKITGGRMVRELKLCLKGSNLQFVLV